MSITCAAPPNTSNSLKESKMTYEHHLFRDDLATDLVKKLAPFTSNYDALVDRAFLIADRVVARISADFDKMIEEENAKAAKTRAARQAEFNALVGGIAACGSTSTNTNAQQAQNQGARVDRRKADCDCSNLRRSTDKVEVHELSPEQAIAMIDSLIFPPKR